MNSSSTKLPPSTHANQYCCSCKKQSMKTFILLLLLTFSSILITPAASIANANQQNQKIITWYRADFPPISIPRGSHANEGFFDKIMSFLIERLPEYEHQFQIANFKRIMLELENNNNVCCPSLYKTKDRERFVSFSAPAMIVLPNGIITSKKNSSKFAPHLDANGSISLYSLLRDTKITLGISNGRTYSGGIDQIVQQFDGKNNLLVRSGDDVFQGLMNMMYMGRIDCLLGYPAEAGYFVREHNKDNDFNYYPIKESSVTYTVGHIGCPNNEWGRSVISRIDKIVKQHRNKEFFDFYDEWLDDATKKSHQNMAQEYFNSLAH